MSTPTSGWPSSCVVCKGSVIVKFTKDYAFYSCGGEANKWGWIAGDYRCDELKALAIKVGLHE